VANLWQPQPHHKPHPRHRKQPVLTKPAQQELGYDLARQLRELVTPVAEPDAMLITVNADGTVDAVPELAAA
jgi:hypothetical protein